MPLSLRSNRARWAVPGVGAVLVTAVLVVAPMGADASPKLPPRTPAELLASTRAAAGHPFSGTVVETARLGLPELPSSGRHGSTGLSLASLVTGSHTARVWYAGPDRSRVALVGDLAETDVIRSGRDVWTWDSAKNTAQHRTLPTRSTPDHPSPSTLPPGQAASQALAAIDPTTAVSVDGTASVAGRAAYELVLRPRDTRSLVGQVRLAVDSATSTPLRVEIFTRTNTTTPAFVTAFTSVTFATPSASVFTFRPPPGAKVSEQQASGQAGGTDHSATPKAHGAAPKAHTSKPKRAGESPTVLGTGWTSVLVLRGVDATGATSGPELSALLRSASRVSGPYGSGRMLSTALVSALLLDDGRLFVGSVTPAVLEQAAASASAR